MKERGKIVRINENIATLFVKSKDECNNCPMKKFCTPSSGGMELKAINEIDAKIGDEVEIETSLKRTNWVIFFLFIVPVLMLLFGVMLGKKLMGTDSFGIFMGFIMIGLYFAVLSGIDRYLVRKGKIIPKITKIIYDSQSKTLKVSS